MKRLMTILFAAALLAGCGKNEAAKTAEPEQEREVTPYADLPVEAVLVTVNGKPLTKLDVETDLTLQLALLRIVMPNISGERIRREQDRIIRKSISGYIRRRALMDEAERRGIAATAEEIEAVHTNFMGKAFRGSNMTYAELCGKLRPAMAKKINADLAADASVLKLERALAAETAYVPTDAEVAAKLVKITDYNKRTREIERKTWMTATNAWVRLKTGESFERTAERLVKRDEHITFEPDWGSFELAYFNDSPALQNCLKAMKPGMFTPPVAADNGIVIVRMDHIVEPTRPGESVRYNLTQIHFALPEYYNDYTAETLKADLAKEMSARQLQAKLDALIQAVDVKYPSGPAKQLFAKTQKQADNTKGKRK